MKIHRTYPQPDSPQPFIGPRERAMAVFKYLMDIEPEAAVLHPRFELIVAAFKQAGVQAVRAFAFNLGAVESNVPPIVPSIAELLTGETDSPDVEIKPFRRGPAAFGDLSSPPKAG